jgi:signal transduction histidine kinase
MTVIPRERPNFVATIAHELRGPVSALETASELLDRDFDLLETGQVRVMVSGIHRRAVWMRSLLENLLVGAAVREGRLSVHPRPLDIGEAIREAVDLARPLFDRKGQTVTVRTVAACPLVEGDAHRITQVLLNLLTNAHKYTDAGTAIEIDVSTAPGIVRVSISDRGPGLPSDAIARAFRAYDRAGRSGGDGVGIGLWVVRSIVKAHGGKVGALNRVGGGATFWFELRTMVGRPTRRAIRVTGPSAPAERIDAV